MQISIIPGKFLSDLVSKSLQDGAFMLVQQPSSIAMSGSIPKRVDTWRLWSHELIGVCRRPCTDFHPQNNVFCPVLISSWKFGLASPPDHPEILLGTFPTSTLPEKTYKRPLKPNIKHGGDLWTAVGLALPVVFFSWKKKPDLQVGHPFF